MALTQRTLKERRRTVFVAVATLLIAGLWLLPFSGQACGEIERCRSTTDLDVDALEGDGSWEPQRAGLSLSPDGSEVAVALWNEHLRQHRLAVFSSASGELLASFENGDLAYNPVYSNDGQLLAASTADKQDDGTIVNGEVTIWNRASEEIETTVLAWDLGGRDFAELQDDPDEVDTVNGVYEWRDCSNRNGFSNDGLFFGCGGGSGAVHLTTGDAVAQYAYAPGFNTLPSGDGYATGRTVYDPEVSRPASLTLSSAQIELVSPRAFSVDPHVVEIEGQGWAWRSTALRGDSTQGAATRQRQRSGLERWLPRLFYPAGELHLIDGDGENYLRWELDVAPATGRYDLSGTTYALLTEDLQLLLFDTA